MRFHHRLSFLLALLPALAFSAPLAVDPASVKITVDAHATMHAFTGTLEKAAVSLDADPESGTITTATVRFAWADLKTGDKGRDKEMIHWATATSPEGVFLLLRLAPGETPESYTATGSLALNGRTKEITFPVKIVRDARGWAVSGATTIDHRDWGLPKIRKFGMLTVDPVVTIRFSLNAAAGA